MTRCITAVMFVTVVVGCGSTRAVASCCHGCDVVDVEVGGDHSFVMRSARRAMGGTPRYPCGAPGVIAKSSNKASISSLVICGDEDIEDDGDAGGVVNSDGHDDASSSVFIDGGVDERSGTLQATGDVATSRTVVSVHRMGDVAASRSRGDAARDLSGSTGRAASTD